MLLVGDHLSWGVVPLTKVVGFGVHRRRLLLLANVRLLCGGKPCVVVDDAAIMELILASTSFHVLFILTESFLSIKITLKVV